MMYNIGSDNDAKKMRNAIFNKLDNDQQSHKNKQFQDPIFLEDFEDTNDRLNHRAAIKVKSIVHPNVGKLGSYDESEFQSIDSADTMP